MHTPQQKHQRKYIDLIHQVSSNWVNWDPPKPIGVGSFGVVDRGSGDFEVHGSIYDDEFQKHLDDLGLEICVRAYQPEERGVEEKDSILASKGAVHVAMSLGPQNGFAGLATAPLSGQWQFENGRRDALLIMYCPRMKCIPAKVLEHINGAPMLKDEWLVTNVYVCPAFTMYLSNKSGERVSLALTGQVPLPTAPGTNANANANANVSAEGGLDWWSDAHADLFRKACDKAGNYCYTPLFTLKRPRTWKDRVVSAFRVFRDGQQVDEGPPREPAADDAWEDCCPEWQPLDEDGDEDPIDLKDDDEVDEV